MADSNSNGNSNRNPRPTTISTPPPLDPFPAYSTPFPRPPDQNDDENPFIQFRRFADQQFATLFQSLGIDFSDWNDRQAKEAKRLIQEWQERTDEMNRGNLEGTKKAREQEMEERRRRLHEQEQQLGGLGGLQGHGQRVVEIGPLFAFPGTELDMYEEQQMRPEREKQWGWGTSRQQQRAPETQEKEQPLPAKASSWKNDWFTLGYDGRRRMASQAELDKEHEKLMKKAVPHSIRSTRRLDPIGNPDHTVPWLLINPYSPLYVCNPSSERLVGAFFAQSPQGTLNVLRPWYMQHTPSHVDEQLAKRLPWADAFEDLVSLENTGKMGERNYSTWRTPDDWLLGMAARGSLKGWEVNEEGSLVRTKEEGRRCGRDKNRWQWKNCREKRRQKEEEKAAEREATQNRRVESSPSAQATYPTAWYKSEPEKPAGMEIEIWHSADAVTDAMQKVEELGRITEIPELQVLPAPPTTSSPAPVFSSSSSTSWSRSNRATDEADSIVSTLTTTERKTLPDGSVETKRVLKTRFANGREESSESVERENARASKNGPSKQLAEPWLRDGRSYQGFGEQQGNANDAAMNERKGGWFWK